MRWRGALLALLSLLSAACSGSSAPYSGKAAQLDGGAQLADLLRYPFASSCPAEPRGHRLDPVRARAALEEGGDSVTWIGHSTVLLRLGGLTVLTDPVFGDETTPLPSFGPCRIAPPAIALDDLPPLDVVLVSHDHYDHFEPAAIRRLAARHPLICMLPLGVGEGLAPLGCAETVFLDWGDSVERGGVRFLFLPAQHWSGRGLLDRNASLWGSFAVIGDGVAIYFAGDTGYGPHLQAIGETAGPFDLALLPIGGYEPREVYRAVHVDPAEALQAMQDLGAAAILAIHWGTFALGAEPPFTPPEILRELARAAGIAVDRLWVLRIGETRVLPQVAPRVVAGLR